MTQEALLCQNVSCRREQWRDGKSSEIIDFCGSFTAGSLHGIAGPDGCGKGLLLNVAGLLERADTGSVFVCGQEATGLPGQEIIECRNRCFGYLFSRPALLPGLSVAENVAMPLFRICGAETSAARKRTLEVLDFCGVGDFCSDLAESIPAEMQDLAALARALVHNPPILLAIAPRHSERLLAVARRAAEELGVCVLWGGEEEELSAWCHEIFRIEAGRMVARVNS